MSTSMNVTEFLEFVEREADLAPPHAERAVQATLETLGERISSGESDDLAAELPEPLRDWVRSEGNAEALDFGEFLRRVAERERTDGGSAQRLARAVFAALGRTVSVAELSDMASELPKDFEPLLAAAQPPPAEQPDRPPLMTADEFINRVAVGPAWTATRRAAPPKRCSRRWPTGSPVARSTTSRPSSPRRCTRHSSAARSRATAPRGRCRSMSSWAGSPSARACRPHRRSSTPGPSSRRCERRSARRSSPTRSPSSRTTTRRSWRAGAAAGVSRSGSQPLL